MTDPTKPGLLVLAGGEEFMPGNERPDELLVAAAKALGAERRAYIVATAAARHHPEQAVATARRWFAGLGLAVDELALRTKTQAASRQAIDAARAGSLFYLCGGDPGIVPAVLRDAPAWVAILEAWRVGAGLAGASAGAMALGEWTLIRARMPGDAMREPRPGLGVVPRVAVLPHFSDFGHRWINSASEALADRDAVLLGVDARTAAVWNGDAWRAMGIGAVTVIGGELRRFASGDVIDGLPRPAESAT